MLDDPRRWRLELEVNRCPRGVGALDRHGAVALNRDQDVPERQTAFLIDLVLLRASGDHRIHEDAVLVLVDEDEKPPKDADLRRREADALRLVHERGHALDKAPEVLVVAFDLPRLHTERSVAVLPYPGKSDEPPRLPFQLLVGV